MEVSKNIENTIKHFNKHIDFKKLKLKKNVNIHTIQILNNFYNDIKHSYKYISLLIKKGDLNTNIKEKSVPKTNLLNSKYIPGVIKSTIIESNGYIECDVKIYDTSIKLYILLKNKDFNNLNKYDNIILNTLVWFKFALLYSKMKTKKITVYLYLTDYKKRSPENANDILGAINCNTAITTACNKNGEILIYRKEEWFKVLIHETFHLLCLDFSGLSYNDLRNKIKKMVNINSDYEISETYSEFWALLLNTVFYSYNLLNDKEDFKTFITYFDFFIMYEQIFSLFQCVKILKFMNLNYDILYSNDKSDIQLKKMTYKENTNVYAYYILKLVLLIYYDEFIEWCDSNNINILLFNKLPFNLNSFYVFIKNRYKSPGILKKINYIEEVYDKLNSTNLFLSKTLQMTLIS